MFKATLDFDSKKIQTIERKFADTMDRHIPEAARRSLMDGQKKARTEIHRILKSYYDPRKVKRKEIIALLDENTKARLKTGDIDAMFINMKMPDKSFSLIRFIIGRKKPARQKGVKIKDRKKLRVRIKPGNDTIVPHGFIAKGKGTKSDGSTNYHVFRRGDRKSDGRQKLHKMATPSINSYAEKFLHPLVRPPVEKKMQSSFIRNLRMLSKVF